MTNAGRQLSLIDFPIINDPRGNLTFIQDDDAGRIFTSVMWHKGKMHSAIAPDNVIVVVALSGNVSARACIVDEAPRIFELNHPATGLYATNECKLDISATNVDSIWLQLTVGNMERQNNRPYATGDNTTALDRHGLSSVADCKMIKFDNNRPIDIAEYTPFEIRRLYYLYDMPEGAERGGHSHFEEERLMVTLDGCVDVKVFDGIEWLSFRLSSPEEALYIPPGIWRVVENISKHSICMAVCNNRFDESDYVRDFNDFKALTRLKTHSK